MQLGVAAHGDLRWAAVDVTGPAEEARRRLDLSTIAAVALGRALAAAALMLRFTTKEAGRLVVEVLGDGPLKKVVAEADTEGRLRGMVGEPRLETPEDEDRLGGGEGDPAAHPRERATGAGRYSSQVEPVRRVGQTTTRPDDDDLRSSWWGQPHPTRLTQDLGQFAKIVCQIPRRSKHS